MDDDLADGLLAAHVVRRLRRVLTPTTRLRLGWMRGRDGGKDAGREEAQASASSSSLRSLPRS